MIRLATEADAQAIADIFNENIDERGYANGGLLRDRAEIRARSLASCGARHPTFVHIGACNEILGWCALKPLSIRPSWTNVSEIALYVKRSSRNRVVGAQLLVHLLDAARVLNYTSLIARVLSKNHPSLRGLLKAGFEEVARVRDAALLHDEWIDLLCLQKELGHQDEHSVAYCAARFRAPAIDPPRQPTWQLISGREPAHEGPNPRVAQGTRLRRRDREADRGAVP